MQKIIVINGVGGAGKDTVCDIIQKYSSTMNISSVDEVKTIAKFVGWDGKKEHKDRLFLSDLKDLLTWYNDRPLKYILEQIEVFQKNYNDGIMLIHIREASEIEKLKTFVPNLITLLVQNNNITDLKGNHADDDCEDYTYDYIIDNSYDLETLNQTVQTFIEELYRQDGEGN